jgi:AraC family transcriptional regulator
MKIIFDTPDDVTIREVAVQRRWRSWNIGEIGPTFGDTFQRFIAWRRAAGLSPETSSDLQHLPFRKEFRENPADYSMDLCIGTDQLIEANDEQS